MRKRYIAVLMMTVTMAGAACGKFKGNKQEQPPLLPEQAIEHFTVTETEGGKPHWVLDATSARIMEKEQQAFLQKPHIKFFEKGKYVSTLTAEHGRINTANYDLWGEGKCILDTVKNEHLETSNLYYKSDVKKIMTNDPVTLTRPDEIVHGQGLEATPDLENITIRKQRVELRK